MADEENKNTGQNNQQGQNTGGTSNSKKKRRRRPRKRKPTNKQDNTFVLNEENSNTVKPNQPKKKKRRRPKKRPQNKPQQKKEEIPVEDTMPVVDDQGSAFDIEPLESKPVQKPKDQTLNQPESLDDEGGFDLSNIEDSIPQDDSESVNEPENDGEMTLEEAVDEVQPEPVVQEEVPPVPEVEPEPEAPVEEEAPKETPSEIPQPTDPNAPSDWSQLKEAIKKDHVQTEEKIKKGGGDIPPEAIPAATAAGAAVGAAAAEEPEPQPEPEPVKEPEPEVIAPSSLPDDELERKEVMGIIKRYAIGGCAVILIISAIFFFRLPQRAYEGITGLFSGGDQTQEVTQEEPDQTDQTDQTQTDVNKELESTFVAGENEGTSRDKFEEGVETALISGDGSPAYEGAPDAIKTLYITGLEVTTPVYTDRIGSYMSVLLKLQNSFSTDIHQMLDDSRDREETLEVHLRDLQEVYQESVDTLSDVNEEKDDLKVQFNAITTQKETLEKDFFVSLEQLEGNKANDLLNSFIETSKRQTELKAEYNALNKVSTLFDTAISNMDARIKDIQFNKKALIEGVQVVDITGSDLDLIIQEGDLF